MSEVTLSYVVRGAIVALSITVGGCSEGAADSGSTAVVRDSAGVQIVDNTAPTSSDESGWRIAETPLLVIGDGGGADPAQQLFRVQAVHRLGDGRVIVADGGSAQVRFYAPDGALRRAAGGQGGGPGEFVALSWIDVGAGDSVIAYDMRQRRFTVFDDTGTFVRAFAPTSPDTAPLFPRPVGLLGDGAVLATASATLRGTPVAHDGPMRDTLTFLRIARDGAMQELPARVPGAERVLRVSPRSIEIVTPPFAHVLATAVRDDGAYATSGDRYEIAQYDTTGRLVRLLRLPGVERTVTSDDVEAHIARVTDDITDPGERQRRAATIRGLAVPERMPAVARLVVDDAGRLWAMDYLAPRDTAATWRVFDAEGRWVSAVTVPRAFAIHEVSDGHAVGVYRDENDVEQVRVYALDGVP